MTGLQIVATVKLCLKGGLIHRLLDWVACVCADIVRAFYMQISSMKDVVELEPKLHYLLKMYVLFNIDVIHTSCLVSHIKSFPSHTAPAGYICPACSTSVRFIART